MNTMKQLFAFETRQVLKPNAEVCKSWEQSSILTRGLIVLTISHRHILITTFRDKQHGLLESLPTVGNTYIQNLPFILKPVTTICLSPKAYAEHRPDYSNGEVQRIP